MTLASCTGSKKGALESSDIRSQNPRAEAQIQPIQRDPVPFPPAQRLSHIRNALQRFGVASVMPRIEASPDTTVVEIYEDLQAFQQKYAEKIDDLPPESRHELDRKSASEVRAILHEMHRDLSELYNRCYDRLPQQDKLEKKYNELMQRNAMQRAPRKYSKAILQNLIKKTVKSIGNLPNGNRDLPSLMRLINEFLTEINQQLRLWTPFLDRDLGLQLSKQDEGRRASDFAIRKATNQWLNEKVPVKDDHTGNPTSKTVAELHNELLELRETIDRLSQNIEMLSRQIDAQKARSPRWSCAHREDHNTGLDKQLQSLKNMRLSVQNQCNEIGEQLRSHPISVFRKLMNDFGSRAGGSQTSHPSHWDTIKSRALNTFYMNIFLDCREQFVWKIIFDVKKELEQEYASQPDIAAQIKEIKEQDFGSLNPTSDLDIMVVLSSRLHRVLPPGLDVRVVEEFNKRFREYFGMESGDFFDTNLYTRGLTPDINDELGEITENGVRTGGKGPYAWKHPAAEALHNRNQDVLSLVKQRKYMTSAQWNIYLTELLEHLPMSKRAEVRSRYEEANALYERSFGDERSLLTQQRRELARNSGTQGNSNLELMASNVLYIEKLRAADRELEQLNNFKGRLEQEMQRAKYRRALGEAFLFANEPYFSEGTVRHVLANEQGLKHERTKLAVNLPQALQSVNENFGDIEKQIRHFSALSAPLGEVAVQTSKYIGRFARAVDMCLNALPDKAKLVNGEPLKILLRQKDALQTIEPDLLKLKSGRAPSSGSSENIALSLLRQQPELEKIVSTKNLEKLIRDIALQVNCAVRSSMSGRSLLN